MRRVSSHANKRLNVIAATAALPVNMPFERVAPGPCGGLVQVQGHRAWGWERKTTEQGNNPSLAATQTQLLP